MITVRGFIQKLAAATSRLSDEAKLSFAAGAACCCLGGLGWFANYRTPGSTTLSALLVVGCCYLLAGVVSTISSARADRQSAGSADAVPPDEHDRTDKRQPDVCLSRLSRLTRATDKATRSNGRHARH